MKLWSTQDVAQYLGKSPKWIRENIKKLEMPGFKLGQHWRFDPNEIQNWVNTHKPLNRS